MPQRITILELRDGHGRLRLVSDESGWHVDHWFYPTHGSRKAGPFETHREALDAAYDLTEYWGVAITSVA